MADRSSGASASASRRKRLNKRKKKKSDPGIVHGRGAVTDLASKHGASVGGETKELSVSAEDLHKVKPVEPVLAAVSASALSTPVSPKATLESNDEQEPYVNGVESNKENNAPNVTEVPAAVGVCGASSQEPTCEDPEVENNQHITEDNLCSGDNVEQPQVDPEDIFVDASQTAEPVSNPVAKDEEYVDTIRDAPEGEEDVSEGFAQEEEGEIEDAEKLISNTEELLQQAGILSHRLSPVASSRPSEDKFDDLPSPSPAILEAGVSTGMLSPDASRPKEDNDPSSPSAVLEAGVSADMLSPVASRQNEDKSMDPLSPTSMLEAAGVITDRTSVAELLATPIADKTTKYGSRVDGKKHDDSRIPESERQAMIDQGVLFDHSVEILPTSPSIPTVPVVNGAQGGPLVDVPPQSAENQVLQQQQGVAEVPSQPLIPSTSPHPIAVLPNVIVRSGKSDEDLIQDGLASIDTESRTDDECLLIQPDQPSEASHREATPELEEVTKGMEDEDERAPYSKDDVEAEVSSQKDVTPQNEVEAASEQAPLLDDLSNSGIKEVESNPGCCNGCSII